MPRRVPMKRTACPRARSSRATASAGITCPPDAAAGHHECRAHPSCSLTLNSIPSEASVLSKELPP